MMKLLENAVSAASHSSTRGSKTRANASRPSTRSQRELPASCGFSAEAAYCPATPRDAASGQVPRSRCDVLVGGIH